MRNHGAFIAAVTALMTLGQHSAAPARESAPHSSHAVLGNSLATLEADFNAEEGKVRLLFIVGPTCSVCLRGMDDLDKALGDIVRSDDRIAAFVIHVPTLGAEEKDVAPAAKLFDGVHIRHYWDPEGRSGLAYQEALSLEVDGKGVFAWDVWMIYGPDAVWMGDGPPAPSHWEHQLGLLRKTHPNYLDAARFAAKLNEQLVFVR